MANKKKRKVANKKKRRAPNKNRGTSENGKLIILDVVRTRRQLEKTVVSLTERYGFDGVIDEEADEFAAEYDRAVNDIIQPYLTTRDADVLGEFAIARLTQLLRIDIMDDGEFADYELDEITMQLEYAFDYGTDKQRAHLLDLLGSYLKSVLGESREWLYDLERSDIEDFIGKYFAVDAHFSAKVIELADWHLERSEPNAVDVANKAAAADLARELLSDMNAMDEADQANMLDYALTEADDVKLAGEAERAGWADFMDKADLFLEYLKQGNIERMRMHWALIRMIAMAARGDSGDALHEYAEELDILPFTEALYLIAYAYKAQGQPRKAIAVLRENADAAGMYASSDWEGELTLVDCLLDLAYMHYSKAEMIDLYHELLLNESYVANFDMYDRDWRPDVIRWYEQMHAMLGDSEWGGVREELLTSVSDERKKVLLIHEEFSRKFHIDILKVLGERPSAGDLFGADCSGPVPLLPATNYIRYAEIYVQKAKSRKEYRKVGLALVYAAELCGEVEAAQECATKIAAAHARKYALLEELYQFGFDV